MANSYFIPWLLGKNPKTKVIVVTYGDDLSTTLGARHKKSLYSVLPISNIFPHTVLENDRMQATRLRTDRRGGQVIFTSIHGVASLGLVQTGSFWMIPCRPHTCVQRYARTILAQVFRHSVTTRLNDPETGKMLLVQQRISPNDLCGDLTRDPRAPLE